MPEAVELEARPTSHYIPELPAAPFQDFPSLATAEEARHFGPLPIHAPA